MLESAGLVRHRSVGTRNLYALAPEGTALQGWLVSMWDSALSAFADELAGRPAAEDIHKGGRR